MAFIIIERKKILAKLIQYFFKKTEEIKPHMKSLTEQQSVTDEIMKYKDLLDEGIITEKEFSIKEKELLRKIM